MGTIAPKVEVEVIKNLIESTLKKLNTLMTFQKEGLFAQNAKFKLTLEEGMAINENGFKVDSLIVKLYMDEAQFPILVTPFVGDRKLAYKHMMSSLLMGSVKQAVDISVTYLAKLQNKKWEEKLRDKNTSKKK